MIGIFCFEVCSVCLDDHEIRRECEMECEGEIREKGWKPCCDFIPRCEEYECKTRGDC